ncbi:hypothetical protein ACIP00_005149, partial [Salmonella enterica]
TDIPPDRHELACRSPALDLDLDGEFTPPETQHYPALPLEKLPELLSRTDKLLRQAADTVCA